MRTLVSFDKVGLFHQAELSFALAHDITWCDASSGRVVRDTTLSMTRVSERRFD